MNTFSEFPLNSSLKRALEDLGYVTPTPIQQKTLSCLLDAKAGDFHGQAQTGTGKTLAFGLPLLHLVDGTKRSKVQALVVAPTRELADQISQELKRAARYMPEISIVTVYGGVPIQQQIRDLDRGAQIVVGTPGRIYDHIMRKTLDLNSVQTLVLDEADIMLDMGFKEEVEKILSFVAKDRRIWLFSATVKEGIQEIKRKHMRDTIFAKMVSEELTAPATRQYYCSVMRKNRVDAIMRFVDMAPNFYGFVFCPTKLLASEVADALTTHGYSANALHGDMSQALRNSVIKKFKEKSFTILVATDVAARGIDISGVTHVVNYSLPEDQESYVHRIGRTGRAGKEGIAITLVNQSEVSRLSRLAKRFNAALEPINVPRIDDIITQRVSGVLDRFEKNSETPKVQEKHLAALRDKLATYSKEDLVEGVMKMLATTVLHGLEGKNDHAATATFSLDEARGEGRSSYDESQQEIMLNIGEDDGISTQDLRNHIVGLQGATRDDIKRLRVIRRRSFLTVPEEKVEFYIRALKGAVLGGIVLRPASVFASDKPFGGGNRGGGFGGGNRNRGNGGNGHHRRSNNSSRSSYQKRG